MLVPYLCGLALQYSYWNQCRDAQTMSKPRDGRTQHAVGLYPPARTRPTACPVSYPAGLFATSVKSLGETPRSVDTRFRAFMGIGLSGALLYGKDPTMVYAGAQSLFAANGLV